MKSIYHGTAGANSKLKGKLTKSLSCGCCVLQNFKWSEKVKEATKEVKDFKERKV